MTRTKLLALSYNSNTKEIRENIEEFAYFILHVSHLIKIKNQDYQYFLPFQILIHRRV